MQGVITNAEYKYVPTSQGSASNRSRGQSALHGFQPLFPVTHGRITSLSRHGCQLSNLTPPTSHGSRAHHTATTYLGLCTLYVGTYIQSTPPAHPYSTLQTIDNGTPDPDLVLALSSIMEDPHDPDLPWSILLPACPIRRTTVLPPIPYALSCQVRSLR